MKWYLIITTPAKPSKLDFASTFALRSRVQNVEELLVSVERDDQPDPALGPELRALWLARKGRWHEAHDLCQEIPGPNGAWIHAWLHREEGDYGNACYWYAQAGKEPKPREASLEEEWSEIARACLGS